MLKIKTPAPFYTDIFNNRSEGFDFGMSLLPGEITCYSQDLSAFNGLYPYDDDCDGGDRFLDIIKKGKLDSSGREDSGSVTSSLLCYGYGPEHVCLENVCSAC